MKKIFIYSGIIILCFMVVSINYAIAKETKEEFQADQTAIKKQIMKNSEYAYWATINGSPDLASSLLGKLKYALAVKESEYWPEDIDFSSHLLKIAKALNHLNYSSKKEPNLKIAHRGLKLIRNNTSIPSITCTFCIPERVRKKQRVIDCLKGNIIKNYFKKEEYKHWIDPRNIPDLLYNTSSSNAERDINERVDVIMDIWEDFKDNPITKFYLDEIIMWFSYLEADSYLDHIREYYGYGKFDIDNDGNNEYITPKKLYKIIRKGKDIEKAKKAAFALGKFGGKDALNYLETALLGKKIEVEVGNATITKKVPPISNRSVKLAVAESLLSLGNNGINVLTRALEKEDPATRRIVLKALKKANNPLILIPLLRSYLTISHKEEKEAYQETIASIFRNTNQAGFKKDVFITEIGMLTEAIGITESDNLQEKFIELANKIGPFGGKLQIMDSLIEVIETDKHMENLLSAYVALSSIKPDKYILEAGFERYKDLYNSNLSEMTWKGKYENVKTIGTGWIEPWKETKLEEINKRLERIRQTWDVGSLKELKDLLLNTQKEKLLRNDIRKYKNYKEEKKLVKLKADIYTICYGTLEGLSHVEIDKGEQYKKLAQATALFVESTRDPKAIPVLKNIVLDSLPKIANPAIKALGSIATKSSIDALDEILNVGRCTTINKTLLSTLGNINMGIIPKHYLGIECEKTKKWKETIEYAKEKFFKWVERAKKFFNNPSEITKFSTKGKSNIYRWYTKYKKYNYPKHYLGLSEYAWNKIIKECGYEDKTFEAPNDYVHDPEITFPYVLSRARNLLSWGHKSNDYLSDLLFEYICVLPNKSTYNNLNYGGAYQKLPSNIWIKEMVKRYFSMKKKQEKVSGWDKLLKNIYKLYQGKHAEFVDDIPKDILNSIEEAKEAGVSIDQLSERALWHLARWKTNFKAFEFLIEINPKEIWMPNLDYDEQHLFYIAEKIYKNPSINNIKELIKNDDIDDIIDDIRLAAFYSKLLNKKVKNVAKVLKEAAESLAGNNKNMVLSQFTPIRQVLGGEKLDTLKSEVVNKEFPALFRINASKGLIATLVRKNKSEQPNLANEIASMLIDMFENPKVREGLTEEVKSEEKIRLRKGITSPLAYLFNYCKGNEIKLKKKKDFITTLKNMFKKNTVPNVRNSSLYLMENLMEDKELLNFMKSIDTNSLSGEDKYYFIALRNILLKHPEWINDSNIRPAVETFRGAGWSEKANSKTDIINSKEITQQFLYYYFFGPIYSLNKSYSDKLLDALHNADEIQYFLTKQKPYDIPQGSEIVLYTNSSLPGQQKSTSTSSVSKENKNYYNNGKKMNIKEFNNYKPFEIKVEEQKENNGIFF